MASESFLIKLLNVSVVANIAHMLMRYLKAVIGRGRQVVAADSIVPPQRKKKLAVIGCGPSINNLPDDFFDNLDDYDVTAFSYAALLPIKDIHYYLYEIPRGTLQQHHEAFLYPTLKERETSGSLKQIMLKNPHAREGMFYDLFPRVTSSMTFAMHMQTSVSLKSMLKFLSRLGLAKKAFFQTRASLFSTCYWADALGYEEILLVGIDLNTSKYFYEEDSKWINVHIPNPYPDEEISKDVHPTNDGTRGLKLEDAMLVLKEHISANILIQNPTSALAKSFDVYHPTTQPGQVNQ